MFAQLLTLILLYLNPFLPLPEKTSATPPGDGGLIWRADRRLTWDDFQSQADAREDLHAMTSTNIDVKGRCFGNMMQFDVKCVFVTKDSWSKNKASQRLLAHEQMHFDLTEIHARLLRQKLAKTQGLCGADRTVFGKIVEAHFAAWKAEQDQYDRETGHGLDAEKQQLWEERVSQRLQSLEAYSYAVNQ